VSESAFGRDGYALGRGVFEPSVLRQARAPLFEALVADGHIEPIDGEVDRVRWVGDVGTFNRHDYEDHLREGVEEMLLKTGIAAGAIATIWGRRARIWQGVQLFVSVPGTKSYLHRDMIPLATTTGAEGQVRLWVNLTQLHEHEGSLQLAAGSHLIPDGPELAPPLRHVLHPDLTAITRNWPSAEQLAPLWRSFAMELGDAVVFRSDVMHGAAPNDGSCLRLALVLTAQDARAPAGGRAGMSLDSTRDLTDLEWVTLAILAAQPTSRWYARCACYPRGIVGRLWAEHDPDRVERTFVTLAARELIEPYEAGDPAAYHGFWSATERGRSEVSKWLTTPSSADSRLLPLKLLLADWLDLDTVAVTQGGPPWSAS
jgi:hypothetical protein